jgi:SAM-dependent methyltransferase
VEYLEAAIPIARARCPIAAISRADIASLPFKARFDAVGCFDVLEHIPDDQLALRNLRNVTKPGGIVLITVPQHRWLWSLNDDRAFHQRRYSRRELLGKALGAGLEPLRVTSFVCLPLPLMILRKFRKSEPGDEGIPRAEFALPAWQNSILRGVLSVERLAIRGRLSWPMGGSLLGVFRRV